MATSKILWVNESVGVKPRFEACLSGVAYTPHRHDTYALAITTQGVQSFNYRKKLQHSLPGQVVVLHPDELHDGLAGTDEPFAYKGMNIEPTELQEVLNGAPLPFINSGVCSDPRLQVITQRLLGNLDQPLQLTQYEDAIFDLANVLQELSASHLSKRKSLPNYKAVMRAKEVLDDCLLEDVCLDDLANVVEFSKWQLSRDFRDILGTSPYRYQMLRRLQQAKVIMSRGTTLAQVALISKFSDQAHFNRQFKASFGLTPRQWQKAFA